MTRDGDRKNNTGDEQNRSVAARAGFDQDADRSDSGADPTMMPGQDPDMDKGQGLHGDEGRDALRDANKQAERGETRADAENTRRGG